MIWRLLKPNFDLDCFRYDFVVCCMIRSNLLADCCSLVLWTVDGAIVSYHEIFINARCSSRREILEEITSAVNTVLGFRVRGVSFWRIVLTFCQEVYTYSVRMRARV